jgi:Family of unknown function (DUF5719)
VVSRRPGGTRGRLVSAAAVIAGLAAVYGVGTLNHPATVGSSTQLGQSSSAAVSAATRACPSPGASGVTAASLATVAVPGSAKQGSAVVTRLSGVGSATAGPTVRTLAAPGVLRVSPISAARKPASAGAQASGGVPTTPGRGGVMVQAAGALAQGLEVEQTSPGGLVTAQCEAPGTDFWFAGPGVSAAAQIDLYLMNTDSQPADVQVEALTDAGPLLGSSDTGIIVPPHGMIVQSLGRLLRSSRVIALHVSTSTGLVVAAVRETRKSADAGGWLPAAQSPSRNLVIPGLPNSSGTPDLYIVVPGNGNAQVKVTAVTAKGSYQPTGGSGIDLPGDSAAMVELPSLSGLSAAIRISSSVPVTATLMVPGGATGAPGAFSASMAPVSEQGIAADNPSGSAGSTELVISAPGKAASVRIVTATSKVGFAGQAGTVVRLAAGYTAVLRIKPPGGKTVDFAVLVTPLAGSGPVYVGRVIRSGGSIRSILPLTSALTLVPLPAARDSLDAVGFGGYSSPG